MAYKDSIVDINFKPTISDSEGERGQEAYSDQAEVTHVCSQLVVNCLHDREQKRLLLRDMTRYR